MMQLTVQHAVSCFELCWPDLIMLLSVHTATCWTTVLHQRMLLKEGLHLCHQSQTHYITLPLDPQAKIVLSCPPNSAKQPVQQVVQITKWITNSGTCKMQSIGICARQAHCTTGLTMQAVQCWVTLAKKNKELHRLVYVCMYVRM